MSGTDRSDHPYLVDSGWFLSLPVDRTDKALLFYADGTVRFRHRCDRGERGVIVCAPALQLDGGHSITTRDPVADKGTPVTVTPSILCSDCGTHGFVRDGQWRAA